MHVVSIGNEVLISSMIDYWLCDSFLLSEHSCLPNQYRCSNGRCISSIWKCDSDNDCGDMSDEQECRKYSAAPHFKSCFYVKNFRHSVVLVCVFSSATTTCDPSNQFRCVASGSCIPLAFKCDHEDDCGDNSDEEHCGKIWISVFTFSLSHCCSVSISLSPSLKSVLT